MCNGVRFSPDLNTQHRGNPMISNQNKRVILIERTSAWRKELKEKNYRKTRKERTKEREMKKGTVCEIQGLILYPWPEVRIGAMLQENFEASESFFRFLPCRQMHCGHAFIKHQVGFCTSLKQTLHRPVHTREQIKSHRGTCEGFTRSLLQILLHNQHTDHLLNAGFYTIIQSLHPLHF